MVVDSYCSVLSHNRNIHVNIQRNRNYIRLENFMVINSIRAINRVISDTVCVSMIRVTIVFRCTYSTFTDQFILIILIQLFVQCFIWIVILVNHKLNITLYTVLVSHSTFEAWWLQHLPLV
jgi:hypothetical protein